MLEFLTRLFDPAGFPPRWQCGQWSEGLGWLHILSDLGVWSAYFAIPAMLGYFVLRRRDAPFRAIFWLFVLFILACGTTHLMEAVIFWWPAYRLAGVIKLLTALVSWLTVLVLIPAVPVALAMRSPEELEEEVRKRTAELAAANQSLQAEMASRQQVEDALRAEVSQRKHAEERERQLAAEAAAANAKFRAFFEQGALFAGIMDVDGTVLEPNRLSWEGCGYTREQIVGKPFWEGPWWASSAELTERIRAASRQAAAGERFRAELPYFVGDGSQRIADVTINPIKDETGRIMFLAPTGTDVTDRKQAEEALREANERKDEFLATLAHELRNPLAPIGNALEILKIVDAKGPAFEQARAMMERQLRHMVRLVDDLLDVSRISRGKVELRRERVSLAVVLQSAVETSRPLIAAAGQQLAVRLPAQPIEVDADVTRLAQVFANLLNNSAKFTPRGGHITMTLERRGSDAVVTVRDDGVGIPAVMLPRVFDLFTQVDRTLERSNSGLGIGLTLAQRLVELHGGGIEARSAGVGQGSEFIVRLPAFSAPPAAALSTAPAPAAPAAQRRLRILIADDNVDAAVSLGLVLQTQGHEVRIVHDGAQAVTAAGEFRPRVVVLDIGMPRLNGYETAQRLRALPGGRELVLIALTGWGQDEDKRRSQEAGFDSHFTKPADLAALQIMLANVPPAAE